uniref:Uncharacterized protein n=1 Tax=Knipowitschia caucasica TaxID=637954 RepID=A0AAV2MR52_KNICA
MAFVGSSTPALLQGPIPCSKALYMGSKPENDPMLSPLASAPPGYARFPGTCCGSNGPRASLSRHTASPGQTLRQTPRRGQWRSPNVGKKCHKAL